jgi:hypothetical protein
VDPLYLISPRQCISYLIERTYVQIFSWLYPQDLLRLSRTTKSFCKILMRPLTKSVWKSALLNARMPKCPPELSEPEYASLAFDTYCHVRPFLPIFLMPLHNFLNVVMWCFGRTKVSLVVFSKSM